MSTRLAQLPHGTVDQIHRQFSGRITGPEAQKLHDHPEVWDVMMMAMRAHPVFQLVHTRFAPLADKVLMVKSWPGIKAEDVDAAVALAHADGTIAGYQAEVEGSPLLDLVINVYRESVPATLLYGRARMRDTFGDRYDEWGEAYAQGVDNDRVRLIAGAPAFVPNRIVVQAVDFGANWQPAEGLILREVQETQARQLADFAGLFNASQSPEWVRQMDGTNVPYAILAALLLNVPRHVSWACSPCVWRCGGRAKLYGDHVGSRFHARAMPVLRKYSQPAN